MSGVVGPKKPAPPSVHSALAGMGVLSGEAPAAQHTPGPVASLEISLRIGQHVRHRDFHGKRVTGVVRGLSVEEDVLHADIALDEAIILPPINADDHELRIYRQHVPAHELAPFDEREELIGEMLAALETARTGLLWYRDSFPSANSQADDEAMEQIDAAIAKATGSAA